MTAFFTRNIWIKRDAKQFYYDATNRKTIDNF